VGQKQKPFEPVFLGDTKAFDIFPAFGTADNGQQSDYDHVNEHVFLMPVDPWILDVLEKVDKWRYGPFCHFSLQSAFIGSSCLPLYLFLYALALIRRGMSMT
jgi:hypothetical protein